MTKKKFYLDTTSINPNIQPPKKLAVLSGINKYANSSVSPLNGCVNDIELAYTVLTQVGYQCKVLTNEKATLNAIKERFGNELTSIKPGDWFVYQNSSHGTQVNDRSGDEVTDKLDEAIVPFDSDPNDLEGTLLLDDWLRDSLFKAPTDSNIVIIVDSCFSGTVTRNTPPKNAAPRYWQPPIEEVHKVNLDDYTKGFGDTAKSIFNRFRFGWFGKSSESEMNHILISGSSDKEYSYDAYIKEVRKYHGAFTYYLYTNFLRAWKSNEAITFEEAHKRTVKNLKGKYSQTSQLEGLVRVKKSPVLGFTP